MHRYLRVDPQASTPLAAQLSQQLLWLIASGKLEEGDELPAVRDLANELGINYHTVRAAYQQLKTNGVITTRQGTRARVLNYDRQRFASSAPRLPTFALGVLVPNYSPYHARFLQGLGEASREDPWLKFICDTHYYTRHVGRYMDQLVAKSVDGIVVTHFETPSRTEIKKLLSPSKGLPPIVYADSPNMPGPSVGFNRVQGAYDIVRHLIDHGHQRIGVISPSEEWSTIADVFRGYRMALDEAGLELYPELVATVETFAAAEGAAALDRLLSNSSPTTAVFAAGDMLALGAMRRARERGISVPHDMAIAGFGKIEVSSLVDPPLTTVSLPPEEMGMEAMTLLRTSIAGEEVDPHQITLEPHLLIRGSCGCSSADI